MRLSDIGNPVYQRIIDLWYGGSKEEADKIGLAHFQHKVPNYQSFPVALANGSVYHMINQTPTSLKTKGLANSS